MEGISNCRNTHRVKVNTVNSESSWNKNQNITPKHLNESLSSQEKYNITTNKQTNTIKNKKTKETCEDISVWKPTTFYQLPGHVVHHRRGKAQQDRHLLHQKKALGGFWDFQCSETGFKKKTLKGGHDFMEKIGGDKKYGEQKQPHLEDSRRSEVVWFFDQIIREDL